MPPPGYVRTLTTRALFGLVALLAPFAAAGPAAAGGTAQEVTYAGEELPFSVTLDDARDVTLDQRAGCAGAPVTYAWRVAGHPEVGTLSGESAAFSITVPDDPGAVFTVDVSVSGTCGSSTVYRAGVQFGPYTVEAAPDPPPSSSGGAEPEEVPPGGGEGGTKGLDCDVAIDTSCLIGGTRVDVISLAERARRPILARLDELSVGTLKFLLVDDQRRLTDPTASERDRALIIATWVTPVPGRKITAELADKLVARTGPKLIAALTKLAPTARFAQPCAVAPAPEICPALRQRIVAMMTPVVEAIGTDVASTFTRQLGKRERRRLAVHGPGSRRRTSKFSERFYRDIEDHVAEVLNDPAFVSPHVDSRGRAVAGITYWAKYSRTVGTRVDGNRTGWMSVVLDLRGRVLDAQPSPAPTPLR